MSSITAMVARLLRAMSAVVLVVVISTLPAEPARGMSPAPAHALQFWVEGAGWMPTYPGGLFGETDLVPGTTQRTTVHVRNNSGSVTDLSVTAVNESALSGVRLDVGTRNGSATLTLSGLNSTSAPEVRLAAHESATIDIGLTMDPGVENGGQGHPIRFHLDVGLGEVTTRVGSESAEPPGLPATGFDGLVPVAFGIAASVLGGFIISRYGRNRFSNHATSDPDIGH